MVRTLPCGCTLDTDFVSEEHMEKGPPFHIVLKGNTQAYVPPFPLPEPEPEPFEDPEEKKKRKR